MTETTTGRVFLDASGSAPLSARTREAYLAALDEGWADPERVHAESRRARSLLDGARASIAALLGSPVEGTLLAPTFGLAFDRAVAGIAAARRGRDTIVASSVERKPLLRIAGRVAKDLVSIPVDANGVMRLDAFTAALASETVALALVQHANQETGIIQPLDAAFAATVGAQVPLVVDATASIGHIDPPLQWDALIADPSDWGGPRGVAVLAFRPGTRWMPVPPIVTGKVSVPAALAAAVALEERESNRAEVAPRLAALCSRLRGGLAAMPGVTVIASEAQSLPHVVTFVCDGIDGEVLATDLDRRGFAVGSGSACTTEPSPESHVLAALGMVTTGNVRLSLHPGVTASHVDAFLTALAAALPPLRRSLG